jgi:hypothetical protein
MDIRKRDLSHDAQFLFIFAFFYKFHWWRPIYVVETGCKTIARSVLCVTGTIGTCDELSIHVTGTIDTCDRNYRYKWLELSIHVTGTIDTHDRNYRYTLPELSMHIMNVTPLGLVRTKNSSFACPKLCLSPHHIVKLGKTERAQPPRHGLTCLAVPAAASCKIGGRMYSTVPIWPWSTPMLFYLEVIKFRQMQLFYHIIWHHETAFVGNTHV